MFGFVGDIIEGVGDAIGGTVSGISGAINSGAKGGLLGVAGTALGTAIGMPWLGTAIAGAAGTMLEGGGIMGGGPPAMQGRSISRNINKNSLAQAQPQGDAVGPSAPQAADPGEIHARWQARMVALLQSVES